MALKKPVGVWPRCRRALYWTHRWLGVGGCLLFVMWFISGVVMMYVAFPALTDDERLAGLSPLRIDATTLGPEAALAALPATARELPPRQLLLERLAAGPQAGPVWRIIDGQGRRHLVSARSGQALVPVDAATATAIARDFATSTASTSASASTSSPDLHPSVGATAEQTASPRFVETLERDQWTVPNGLNGLRPFHRIAIDDPAGTELYVSAVSGEVVRDTTRHERFWNWLGAVPHWIYFTPVRADPPLWRDVVLWISGLCIVSAVTGLVIGILRLRLRGRYRNGRVTPYGGWFAWHHVAGLIGGLFLLTWIVSGWLSMDPNRWFQRAPPDVEATNRFADLAGSSAGAALRGLDWPALVTALNAGPLADDRSGRELRLLPFGGRWLAQVRSAQGQATVLDPRTGTAPVITRSDILQAAQRYRPRVDITGITVLAQEDAHWYSHHQARSVPVWRVVFADEAGTWLHVSPATGQIVGVSDARSRTRRWLFNGLHSLDFPWLIHHRPAWDLVVWLLSIAGTLVSVSGVVIGWRRLRKDLGARPAASATSARPAGRATATEPP